MIILDLDIIILQFALKIELNILVKWFSMATQLL